MKGKNTSLQEGYSELQAKIKEYLLKFEELRGFL